MNDIMPAEKLKTYRFYDYFKDTWVYVKGKDKNDALQNEFGYERARFILIKFKVERVYE